MQEPIDAQPTDVQRLINENPIARAELRAIVAERQLAEMTAMLKAQRNGHGGDEGALTAVEVVQEGVGHRPEQIEG
jgi:hypothetical protein